MAQYLTFSWRLKNENKFNLANMLSIFDKPERPDLPHINLMKLALHNGAQILPDLSSYMFGQDRKQKALLRTILTCR